MRGIMNKKFFRLLALILSASMVVLLCGCEGISSILDSRDDDEPETIRLDQDVVLYEEPDGTSTRMGSIKAGQKVEYISTKRIDGVRWYETDLGWFAIFEMDSSNEAAAEQVKGHVILSGFATTEVDLLSTSSSNASVIGSLEAGTMVEIYQIKDLWAQSVQGWVLLDQIYIPGRTGTNNGWCLVLNDFTGCYSEPSYDSTNVTEYRSMQRVKFYETIVISGVSWAYSDSGWFDLSNTYVEGDTGTGAGKYKVIDKTALNVRVGPSTSYDVIKSLNVKSVVDVLAVINNGKDDWGFMGDGWIYMDLVEAQE